MRFVEFEVYLKTKIDQASQIDRGPLTAATAGAVGIGEFSEKGFHHHLNHRAASHNQFGQQPLHHPGFVLPPKYLSKEEYCSVKSIDDSRASVYYTPHQQHGGTEAESLSQRSVQDVPIHINYTDVNGGSGDDAAAAKELMLMRMHMGPHEMLMHELVQKKMKRERRLRRRQMREAKGAGASGMAAGQGLIEGPAAAASGGGLGTDRMMRMRKGHGKSRRPVLASAMDPEFLRLTGGAEGIPIQDRRRMMRSAGLDYHHRPSARMVMVDEEQQQVKIANFKTNFNNLLRIY